MARSASSPPSAHQVGYQFAADIAKKAIKTGQSVRELLHESGRFTDEEINKILDPHSMV